MQAANKLQHLSCQAVQLLASLLQEEESVVIQGLAWAAVGEMEPQVAQLQHQLAEKAPARIAKLESLLGPAKENLKALEKHYSTQVLVARNHLCQVSKGSKLA